MSSTKSRRWEGYFRPYQERARRRGLSPVQLLDQEWADGRTTAELLLPHLSKDSDVLEIGCGIGRVSRFVAPGCGHLSCADILEEALAEARRNLAKFDNVSFCQINGYDLSDFHAATFDCVFSFTTFFHFDFELVVQYFAAIERVLKPAGVGMLEFKQWRQARDVDSLLETIRLRGGVERYEKLLSKWRYVSKEMLGVLCDYYRLEVLDDDTTKYTFRKPSV